MPKSAFRVIPVLDVKDGLAVHAVGGIRSYYRPLRTKLHASSDPFGIAQAYRDVLGLTELYLADLDAIAGSEPHLHLYSSLCEEGLKPWIDAGIKDVDDIGFMSELDHVTLVAGLETVRGPKALEAIIDRVGRDRVVLSLDLFRGAARIADDARWMDREPAGLALEAIDQGVRRLLLLELSRVGTGQGTGTDELFKAIRVAVPDVEITVGGGISTIDEVRAWSHLGAAAVLVGSALHDGRITREHLSW